MFEGNTDPNTNLRKGPENKFYSGRRIVIRFIDHDKQRYETVGDYYESGTIGEVLVNISKMMDPRFEKLVMIHELIEMVLCDVAGISFAKIDEFDNSPQGIASEEPGLESNCPYRRQHTIATGIEMALAAEMGVDWNQYEDYLSRL